MKLTIMLLGVFLLWVGFSILGMIRRGCFKLPFEILVLLVLYFLVRPGDLKQAVAAVKPILNDVSDSSRIVIQTSDDGTQILYRINQKQLVGVAFYQDGQWLGGLDLQQLRVVPALRQESTVFPVQQLIRSGTVELNLKTGQIQPIRITQIAQGETIKVSAENALITIKSPPSDNSRILAQGQDQIEATMNSLKGVLFVEIQGPATTEVAISLSRRKS